MMSVKHLVRSVPFIVIGLVLCVWAASSMDFKLMVGVLIAFTAIIAFIALALSTVVKQPANSLPEGVIGKIGQENYNWSNQESPRTTQRTYVEQDGVATEMIPLVSEVATFLNVTNAGGN